MDITCGHCSAFKSSCSTIVFTPIGYSIQRRLFAVGCTANEQGGVRSLSLFSPCYQYAGISDCFAIADLLCQQTAVLRVLQWVGIEIILTTAEHPHADIADHRQRFESNNAAEIGSMASFHASLLAESSDSYETGYKHSIKRATSIGSSRISYCLLGFLTLAVSPMKPQTNDKVAMFINWPWLSRLNCHRPRQWNSHAVNNGQFCCKHVQRAFAVKIN